MDAAQRRHRPRGRPGPGRGRRPAEPLDGVRRRAARPHRSRSPPTAASTGSSRPRPACSTSRTSRSRRWTRIWCGPREPAGTACGGRPTAAATGPRTTTASPTPASNRWLRAPTNAQVAYAAACVRRRGLQDQGRGRLVVVEEQRADGPPRRGDRHRPRRLEPPPGGNADGRLRVHRRRQVVGPEERRASRAAPSSSGWRSIRATPRSCTWRCSTEGCSARSTARTRGRTSTRGCRPTWRPATSTRSGWRPMARSRTPPRAPGCTCVPSERDDAQPAGTVSSGVGMSAVVTGVGAAGCGGGAAQRRRRGAGELAAGVADLEARGRPVRTGRVPVEVALQPDDGELRAVEALQQDGSLVEQRLAVRRVDLQRACSRRRARRAADRPGAAAGRSSRARRRCSAAAPAPR